MEITAEIIRGIKYKPFLTKGLKLTDLSEFDLNKAPASCLIVNKQNLFGLSWWRSPKRSRSYPYERVYNTLSSSKRIAVIPVVKDEGADGDRDFLQWDTVALMSLLDIYVILTFCTKAKKHNSYANKITAQEFNNAEIIEQINDICSYYSSALHWNLQQLRNLPDIVRKAQTSYQNISNYTGVKMHGDKGLDDFAVEIEANLVNFLKSSRQKARKAQYREFVTVQPKEFISSFSKAKITITNFLGGMYFFTVDEIIIDQNTLSLIECKHTKKSKLPSINDIKDGLLKMILYSNLENVCINGMSLLQRPILKLTSDRIIGSISSNSLKTDRKYFAQTNKLSVKQVVILRKLFIEAKKNKFMAIVGSGN